MQFLFRHSFYATALELSKETGALVVGKRPSPSVEYAAESASQKSRNLRQENRLQWRNHTARLEILPAVDEPAQGENVGEVPTPPKFWQDGGNSVADFLHVSDLHLDAAAAMVNAHMLRVSSGEARPVTLSINSDNHDGSLAQSPPTISQQLHIPNHLGYAFRYWRVAPLVPDICWVRRGASDAPFDQTPTVVTSQPSADHFHISLWSWTSSDAIVPVRTLLSPILAANLISISCHENMVAVLSDTHSWVFRADFGSALGTATFPKHDLSGSCFIGSQNDPTLLLCGSHVRSKEGKLASWRPQSNNPPVTIYEAKGGHFSNLVPAREMLTKHHQLVLMRHSTAGILLGLWQRPDAEAGVPEAMCVVASLSLGPDADETQLSPPRYVFTALSDVLVNSGTHVYSWHLSSLLQPHDLAHVFQRGPRTASPSSRTRVAAVSQPSDIVWLRAAQRDYAGVILEGDLAVVCPVSGLVARVPKPAEVGHISNLSKVSDSSDEFILLTRSSSGTHMWRWSEK